MAKNLLPKKRSSNTVQKTLAKKSGLTIPTLSLVKIDPAKHESNLEKLLSDPTLVDLIRQRAALGCSTGSIAALLKINYHTFNKWIDQGKEDAATYDQDFAQTPYMRLWFIISEGIADARVLAEASLATRDPEKYLQSKTAALVGDDWIEEANSQEDENSMSTKIEMGMDLIETLKILREQKVDLNEVIDTNSLSLMITPPKKKQLEDPLVANKLLPEVAPCLPNFLQRELNGNL